tara:strand:- start:526 stop:693 length:168 start_codon:yes stop_codon:yes gene_type:complete
MKTFIVKTSATIIEEFTVIAETKDVAREKWFNSGFINVKQTEINDVQIEDIRELN